ncbi:MAG: formate dehydrogenase accessory protein FdhE [Syntrophomonadaceae bacterium]|nr:formate dehydrogenase accessory protein FdhE [Syntrophomonadaceae bacterium]
MDSDESKLVITENETVKQAYKNYSLLKQEVDDWQQERGPYWVDRLSLAETPPYLPILDLPAEAMMELWQRLNIVAKVQISDSDLRELWEQLGKGQNVIDAEMSSRLQMAISGVARLASEMVNEKRSADQNSGNMASYGSSGSAVCPVCGEEANLALLIPPNGQRIMHCSSCSFEWPVKRVGCLYCGSEDSKQQMFLQNEAFPGVEMAVCQICGRYFKEIDARELVVHDFVWEDLRTLPLNFAAENWLAELAKKNNQIN